MVGVARIVGIALVAMNLALVAQPGKQASLNITVTDQAGARISNAVIQARLDNSISSVEIRADALAAAVLSLPSGTYRVSVSAPGFRSWRQSEIQLAQNSTLSIRAELRVADVCCSFIVNEEKIIQTERQMLSASIPLEPLETLAVLPARKLPRSLRPHSRQS
jgi:hypothetical protein